MSAIHKHIYTYIVIYTNRLYVQVKCVNNDISAYYLQRQDDRITADIVHQVINI